MSKKLTNKQSQFCIKPVCAAVLLAFSVQTIQANPIGPTVVNGQASFATAGSTLTVTNTPGTIINWQGFSIGANEITRFAQQSASSAVLNRVISNNPSSILGALQSNGRVFLVNPNGIVFGAGATINVAGLVATTLNMSNADFLAGRHSFTQVPGAQNLSNAGSLTAQGNGQSGGQIYLIAPNVENTGIINAPNGEILLAAGHSVELVNSSNPNLRVNITAPAGDATNVGQLVASSGSLGLFGTVVRNSGTVSADSATLQGGKIVFKASQRVEAGGTISAQGAGGGEIKVLADMQTGTVSVSGILDASAPNSGNGGFIDTSAAHVQVADTTRITTAAPNGKTGTWLIDPNDYTIAASGGDITGLQLSTNLGSSNVTILSSSGATAGNGDINVNDTVSWSANTLTLTAARDININAVMTASGTSTLALDHEMFAGAAKVGFNTDGTFRGRVDFPGRSGAGILTIGGFSYTIINSLGAAGSMTGADLQGMNGNRSGFYALGSNIDASATSGWNSGLGFAPVGTGPAGPPYAYFAGRFDGLGHTITGLTINRPAADYVGLFGFGNGARIRNVGLNGGSVIGRDFVGGLVGYTWSGGSDKISNSYYTGTVTGFSTGNGSVGGLVGANYGSITDSYSTGNVNGVIAVGGLVGWNRVTGAINSSYSTGAVIGGVGSDAIGGLVGLNDGGITNSYSTRSVSGIGSVGGLVGANYGSITNSYSAGSVSGTSNVGGLVGVGAAGVSNSFWDITTSGQGTSASGTGLTTAQMKQQASFTGWDFATTWYIDEGVAYPTLRVFWVPPPPSIIFWDGGAGDGLWLSPANWSGNILPTFANDVLIDTGAAGGSPLITITISSGVQEVNNLVCFENLFISSAASLTIVGTATINADLASNGSTSITGTGVHSITGAVSGTGIFTLNGGTLNQLSATLPAFTVNDFRIASGTFIRALGGDGSAGAPYQLTDIYGVQGMGSTGMLGKAYVLANNIDATGTVNWNAGNGFMPVGNVATPFTGSFNGQNLTVSNLTINRPAPYVGLFGYTNGASISNVGLVGGSVAGGYIVGGLVGWNGGTITGSYYTGSVGTAFCDCFSSDIGGLVGNNSGTISNSYANSNVTATGYSNIGGLVGNNNVSGTISNSYSSGGTVSGYQSVGGLVGDNNGAIGNSYSSGGSVSGTFDFGGLVGANWNTVNTSYSTNAVAAGGGGLIGWDEMGYPNNSYWNIQTSGRATSSGPEAGLTTAQMMTMASFTGWNIASTGGAGTIWRIYEGNTAPLLTSFLKPLAVTANAATKTYDGLAYSGGNGVTYSIASPLLNGTLGYVGTSQGAINAGSYVITASGLYSDQQGYDISYVDGTLTINPAPAPTPAPTNLSFLPDLVNTMLIPGNGAIGSSQSTISGEEKKEPPPVVVVDGETLPAGGNVRALPVCPL